MQLARAPRQAIVLMTREESGPPEGYEYLGDPMPNPLRGPDTREIILTGHIHRPPPGIDAGPIIADAVHNLRAALDHVVWQLSIKTATPPDPMPARTEARQRVAQHRLARRSARIDRTKHWLASLQSPLDGLEPSTPSLPCASRCSGRLPLIAKLPANRSYSSVPLRDWSPPFATAGFQSVSKEAGLERERRDGGAAETWGAFHSIPVRRQTRWWAYVSGAARTCGRCPAVVRGSAGLQPPHTL